MKPFKLAMLLIFIFLPSLRAQEAAYFRIVGPGTTTFMAVTSDGYVTWTNALTNVTCTFQRALRLPDATNWADYVQVPISNHVVTQRLFDPNPLAGMVFIPAGTFAMGDVLNDDFPESADQPVHTVFVSAFYMEKYEVTKALWDEVYHWAGTNGYSFDNAGSGKAANHPVQTINWYDMVKWCNGRSQKEGLVPCYYTDAEWTAIYKTGQVTNPFVKWNANGYRLPTEAEWEKAARGGASGHRFPWVDADTIQHSRANYRVIQPFGVNYYSYDTSPTAGYHPAFNDGVSPYTSPVGYFAENGYGLYDMAGNVWERCWDWFADYSGSPQSDPRGPLSGHNRAMRSGSYGGDASEVRCAYRYYVFPPYANRAIGFRCVKRL